MKSPLDRIQVTLECCGKPMTLCGHLSRADCAGSQHTSLAYECRKCFARVSVTDTWGTPTAEVILATDLTE